jgi:hypothetical protein
MLEKDIEELEFTLFQKEVEVTYFNKLEDTEKQKSIELSLLEKWGKKNTGFFAGKNEQLVGPDKRGEPKYEPFSWNYNNFEELPYEWQVLLLKQYLITLK